MSSRIDTGHPTAHVHRLPVPRYRAHAGRGDDGECDGRVEVPAERERRTIARERGIAHEVRPAPVLLVEGVGSGALVCEPYLSSLVWVEAGRDERRRRGLERDGETYRPHWERWAHQEAAHFAAEATACRADVRVDGAPTAPHDPARELVLLADRPGPGA